MGPGPWESWGRVLAADKHTAHRWEHYLWLSTRMTGSDSVSSGTVPPARATPLTWARWGQPETAGQGLHRGIPSGWEGGHSQRPGMAAVGRREAALGLRLEQIPPFHVLRGHDPLKSTLQPPWLQTHSLHLLHLLPGLLVHLTVTPQLYKHFHLKTKALDPGWVSLSRGKHWISGPFRGLTFSHRGIMLGQNQVSRSCQPAFSLSLGERKDAGQ